MLQNSWIIPYVNTSTNTATQGKPQCARLFNEVSCTLNSASTLAQWFKVVQFNTCRARQCYSMNKESMLGIFWVISYEKTCTNSARDFKSTTTCGTRAAVQCARCASQRIEDIGAVQYVNTNTISKHSKQGITRNWKYLRCAIGQH